MLGAIERTLSGFVKRGCAGPHVRAGPLHFIISTRATGKGQRLHVRRLDSKCGVMATVVTSVTSHVTRTGPSVPGPLRAPKVILVSRVSLRLRPG